MTSAPATDAESVADRLPRVRITAVALVGAVAAWTLATPAPAAQGAARLAAPETLLAALDAVAIVALALPVALGTRGVLVLVAVAAPFHAAIGAAAGASPGFHAAIAAVAAAWGGAMAFAAARTPRVAAAASTVAAFGVPLAAYGLGDFARLPVGPAFLASPLTAPVILAHRAPHVSPRDALPAVCAALVVAGLSWWFRRPAGRGA